MSHTIEVSKLYHHQPEHNIFQINKLINYYYYDLDNIDLEITKKSHIRVD